MGKLYAIGEALIDYIPHTKGVKLKEVKDFEVQVGGAPANVSATVAKLGGQSALISQLGEDSFGNLIVDTLSNIGVDTSHISRIKHANTALAFVSLTSEGERDFSFYRNPSADMLLSEKEIQLDIQQDDILHFSSVALVPSPMKEAHEYCIDQFTKAGATIVFDPNLRFPLWPNLDALKETVQTFCKKAHILKISDEELEFITGIKDEKLAIQSLLNGVTEAVIYTKGKHGAEVHFKDGFESSEGFTVHVEDTTGAGDSFIGAINYQLLQHEDKLAALRTHATAMLRFANAVGAITTTKKGAIQSLPSIDDVNEILAL